MTSCILSTSVHNCSSPNVSNRKMVSPLALLGRCAKSSDEKTAAKMATAANNASRDAETCRSSIRRHDSVRDSGAEARKYFWGALLSVARTSPPPAHHRCSDLAHLFQRCARVRLQWMSISWPSTGNAMFIYGVIRSASARTLVDPSGLVTRISQSRSRDGPPERDSTIAESCVALSTVTWRTRGAGPSPP